MLETTSHLIRLTVLSTFSSAALRRRLRRRLPKAAIAFYGPTKSPLNPTKNTSSHIAGLDEGEATVLSEEDGKFIKVKLKGRKLNGLFYVAQQEGAKMWAS